MARIQEFRLAVCAVLSLLTVGGATAGPYDVTVLPGYFSGVLSNTGLVFGSIPNPDGSVSLGALSGGSLVNLGIPTDLPSWQNIVQPIAVNDSGVVVGTVRGAAGGLPANAFIYSGGTFNILSLVNPSDLGGVATAINATGQIVGYDKTATNHAQAWLWSGGSYSTLNVSGIDTTAVDINAAGTIVGNRTFDCCTGQRGYITGNETTLLPTMSVNGFNDAGQVVGYSLLSDTAAVFHNGSTISLLSVSSSGFGINSTGDVVGWYQPIGFNGPRVFMWDPAADPIDLTPPGFQWAIATQINDLGQILGDGMTTDGLYHWFLLSPNSSGQFVGTDILTTPSGSAPEPATLALLSFGLALLGSRERYSGTHREKGLMQ